MSIDKLKARKKLDDSHSRLVEKTPFSSPTIPKMITYDYIEAEVEVDPIFQNDM